MCKCKLLVPYVRNTQRVKLHAPPSMRSVKMTTLHAFVPHQRIFLHFSLPSFRVSSSLEPIVFVCESSLLWGNLVKILKGDSTWYTTGFLIKDVTWIGSISGQIIRFSIELGFLNVCFAASPRHLSSDFYYSFFVNHSFPRLTDCLQESCVTDWLTCWISVNLYPNRQATDGEVHKVHSSGCVSILKIRKSLSTMSSTGLCFIPAIVAAWTRN